LVTKLELETELSEAGFTRAAGSDGFSGLVGPFFEREHPATGWTRALAVDERHLNPEGVLHGGVLTTFADYVLYRAIGDELTHELKFATITLTCQFLAAGKAGRILTGTGRIVRRTRSVIFAEGTIQDEGRPLLTATGIWKLIEPRVAA
jgi:uncharacterized protein (TIGR00369 family)